MLNIAEGPPGGIPLLLIPGQGCVWQEYCKALPEDYTGVQIADDMCALVEEVVGEPAVISGHSSGGLIAALIAARNPDLVRGVVFEDAPFFATLPERVPTTYVGMDAFASAQTFLQQIPNVCPSSHGWESASTAPGNR